MNTNLNDFKDVSTGGLAGTSNAGGIGTSGNIQMVPVQKPCPCCGHCPVCGRTAPVAPVYPYYAPYYKPYYAPYTAPVAPVYPYYVPYWGSAPTFGNVTCNAVQISGLSDAQMQQAAQSL